jgi:hypothetical protein
VHFTGSSENSIVIGNNNSSELLEGLPKQVFYSFKKFYVTSKIE